MGKTGQPPHRKINSHRFDIKQRKTEESPVAQHFNGKGHTFVDLTVVAHTATTLVSAKYGKSDGLEPWRPHILLEWTSGWTLCETCAMNIWGPLGILPDWHQGYWLSQEAIYIHKTFSINIMCITTIMYKVHKSWGRPHRRSKHREHSALMPISCMWSIVNNI